MISADELRRREISSSDNGYNRKEVNNLLEEAAQTIEAYDNQSEELYHKMEVLASKIEEYRAEEDIIKTAIIKAEKTAEEIRVEAKQNATDVVDSAQEKAKAILDEANAKAQSIVGEVNQLKTEAEKINAESKEQAEKIISQARERASEILKEKNVECDDIIAKAEKKANDAINSSKVVAQNILDQAKEISVDLLEKSREEKEAYELLIDALKGDAKNFLESIKAMYREQLEILDNAKLESDSKEKNEKNDSVIDLQKEVESLVSEMEEMESAIPESITIDEIEEDEEEIIVQAEQEVEQEAEQEAEQEVETEEPEFVVVEEDEAQEEEFELVDKEPEIQEEINFDDSSDILNELDEEDDEPADPMEAVAAFSRTSVNDEPKKESSLFDGQSQAFENFFNVNHTDAHGDRSQVISLIPPEDDEDEEEPRFKGFFKRKNK